MHYFK